MKRRVLYLEHSTDGTVGGSHLCLLEICRHIDQNKYQPVVCFFEENSLIPAFEGVGAEVFVLRLPGNWLPPATFPKAIGRIFAFAVNLFITLAVRTRLWIGVLRQKRVDLVHINNACGYDHDLMLASRLMGKPCGVHERGIQQKIDRRTRFFANRVDRILAISDAVADNLKRQGIKPDRIVRIDDGIDEARFRQFESLDRLRRRLGLPADVPVIGIVGNIKHWKGQHVVVEAVGCLVRSFPDLRCLMVGSVADERYFHQLLSRARELGIPEGTILFTGYEPHPADAMRAMDVVIHASVEPEPFGIVLLEAMGTARPLIATNIGGPKEIVVHGETGLLIPAGDPDALTAAVTALLVDPERASRMGEDGRIRYFERYTAQRTVTAIQREYEQLIRVQAR